MNILMQHDERYRWSQAFRAQHPAPAGDEFAEETAASLRYIQTHIYDESVMDPYMPKSWNSYTIEYRVRDHKRFMTQVLRYGLKYTII
jgi:hypothetical protein